MSLKYNYVVFGDDWDLYKHSYSDLFDKPFARYYPSPVEAVGKLATLHKIHFSEKVNNVIPLPFKGLWNKAYFKEDFQEKKQLCFVFFWRWASIADQSGYLRYLRNKYTGCKIVLFLQDLVEKRGSEILHFRDQYDLILSFDQGDCRKYGFVYHPLVFSSYKGPIKDMPYSDVYFLGQPKNRLDEIFEIYEYLVKQGLKVDMILTKVPKDKQRYSDEIKYINWMSYQENIQHVIHSKCILEVMQKGGKGYTQRCLEAIGLRKKLLTNNSEISKSDFYDPILICQFNTINDIDEEFLNGIKSCDEVKYVNEKDISPVSLLFFIDDKL